MLGVESPQGELFRPDNLLLDHVGEKTIHGFFAQGRHRYFRDEEFAGLYGARGRPSVPPSRLCVALILQTLDGVSDEEAINRSAYDIRWKVALGLELDEKLCAKSTLQLFRAKLILHEVYGELFDKSVDACRQAGLLKRKKLETAIDTTPVLGRGAVKDTFNLISDQIRRVVDEATSLKGWDREEVVEAHGLSRHFGKSFKGSVDLDWGSAEERRALVGQLVADAKVALTLAKKALNGYSGSSESTKALREARELMSDLLLQDIDEEPDDGQGPQIRQGTARDRKVSTTDPEMRHGRKSPSKGFEGYKASVVVDTDAGVILDTDVHPGNAHDSEGAAEAIKAAAERAHRPVDSLLGDTAYGGLETRRRIEETGVELIAKAPPQPRKRGCFAVDDFKVDARRGIATCPAGKRSVRSTKDSDGVRYTFSTADCTDCPLRSRCTTAKRAPRTVRVSEVTEAQRVYRRRQKTKRFRQRYRRRVKVEHRIARLVQLGIRQARYVGVTKVRFQVAVAGAVANFVAALASFVFALIITRPMGPPEPVSGEDRTDRAPPTFDDDHASSTAYGARNACFRPHP